MPKPASDRTLHAYVRRAPTVEFTLEQEDKTVELHALIETKLIAHTLDFETLIQVEQRLADRLAELFDEHGWGQKGG